MVFIATYAIDTFVATHVLPIQAILWGSFVPYAD